MKLITIFILALIFQNMILFNFTSSSNIAYWQIVDDNVMGGRSEGHFKLNSEGYGEFFGEISLENNGGFSSVRYNIELTVPDQYSKFKIRLKGDGKSYQFRVKNNQNERYSYSSEFETSGEWETIVIPFSTMVAVFRGKNLNIPNYQGNQMEEIAFLIGNKKPQNFKLIIDSISIE